MNPASYFWNKDFTSADREKGGLDEGSGVGGVLARLLGKNSRLKKTNLVSKQLPQSPKVCYGELDTLSHTK